MPQSITQSAANGFTPTETAKALQQLAELYIKEARNNLAQSGHIATGALSNSLTAKAIVDGNTLRIDIEALPYFDFVNKGVRGTKGGNGGFNFKSTFPSNAMVTSVIAWMHTKGLAAQAPKQTIRRLAKAGKSITEASAACAIARSILMKGIQPTGFADKALQTVQQQAQSILGHALAVDVAATLPKNLNEL